MESNKQKETYQLIIEDGYKPHNNGGFYKDNNRLWILDNGDVEMYKDDKLFPNEPFYVGTFNRK